MIASVPSSGSESESAALPRSAREKKSQLLEFFSHLFRRGLKHTDEQVKGVADELTSHANKTTRPPQQKTPNG